MDFLPATPVSQADARREHTQGEPTRTEAAPRSRAGVESRADHSADSTRDATPFSRHLEARRKLDRGDDRENDPGPESLRKSGLDSKTDEPAPAHENEPNFKTNARTENEADTSPQHERRHGRDDGRGLSENNSQAPDPDETRVSSPEPPEHAGPLTPSETDAPDETRAHHLGAHDLAHQTEPTEPTALSWNGTLAAGSEAGEAGAHLGPHVGPHVRLEDGEASTPTIALIAQGPQEPAAPLAPGEEPSRRGTQATTSTTPPQGLQDTKDTSSRVPTNAPAGVLAAATRQTTGEPKGDEPEGGLPVFSVPPPPTIAPAVSPTGASEAVQTHEAPGFKPVALELIIALENLGAQNVRVQWHWDRLQTASLARETDYTQG